MKQPSLFQNYRRLTMHITPLYDTLVPENDRKRLTTDFSTKELKLESILIRN